MKINNQYPTIKESCQMKKLRKCLAYTLTLLLLAAMLAPFVSADGSPPPIMVDLRIEGIDECIYNAQVMVTGDSTIAEMLVVINGEGEAPVIKISETAYGAYLSEIDGLAEGDYGGYSGWSYRVNGVSPSLGIGDFTLNHGDSVVIFYGDPFEVGMQYPTADWSRLISDGIIKFTSVDSEYDEDWNETLVTKPVVGATVMFRLDPYPYTTDSRGEISITDKAALSGFRMLQIERYDEETGLPTVLRFAPGHKIYVPFADTPNGRWYEDAIKFCVREEYFRGTNFAQNLFEPLRSMTMAELVTVLARIVGEDVDTVTTPWYTTALEWAVENEIISESEFVFDASLTRETFIYMFYLTAWHLGGSDMSARTDLTKAVDYNKISEDYREAISWAVATGVIRGTTDEVLTIEPRLEVDRATVCQMLLNYFG